MRKLINESDNPVITIAELAEIIALNMEPLTIVYKVESGIPYYVFLTYYDNSFCFLAHNSVVPTKTHSSRDLFGCLEKAMKGGREILVFNREEVYKIFNTKKK